MITQVPSFKTSDGTLHTTKLEALVTEQKLEMRGVIQCGYNGLPLKNGTLTVSDAVNIALESAEKMVEIVRKYNKAIKREREIGLKVEKQA